MLNDYQEKNLIDKFNFANNIKSRGSTYYHGGNIPYSIKRTCRGGSRNNPTNNIYQVIKNDDGTYSAQVYGSNYGLYDVFIDGNNKRCTCTCPHATGGANCKHEYAVLLAISNQDYDLRTDIEEKELIDEDDEEQENQMLSDAKTLTKSDNAYGFNFKKVSEEEIIKGALEADVPIFLHGKSGDGKSARVKEIDPDLTLLYLSTINPESLVGRGVCIPGTKEIISIKPPWLVKLEEKCAREPDKIHILFLDELPNAALTIQGMSFNIILNKEVDGKWKLPENSRIVAAGNETEESMSSNGISEPLFARFAHVYIKTTFEKWIEWAATANIHPAIYAYMIYTKGANLREENTIKKDDDNYYYGYNNNVRNLPNSDESELDEKVKPDPRKWEMASKMLYQTNCPEMLRSLLGTRVTNDFIRFCHQSVMSVQDILNKNYTDNDIRNMNIGERYLTTVTLTTIDEDEYEIVRDFLKKLGKEFVSLFNNLWVRNNEERLLIINESNNKKLKK